MLASRETILHNKVVKHSQVSHNTAAIAEFSLFNVVYFLIIHIQCILLEMNTKVIGIF